MIEQQKVKSKKETMTAMVTDRFLEVFDREAVIYMLRYKEYYKTLLDITDPDYQPFVLLEKYFKKAGGDMKNMVAVQYDRKNGRGRRFAKGALSMQSFPRGVRGLMAKNDYWDIDFINCHPVIVEQLAKSNGIYMSSLPEYIDNREKVFQNIIDINPEVKGLGGKAFVKKAILSVLYGGVTNFNKIKVKTDWMLRFEKEIAKLHRVVPQLFSNEYELQTQLKGIKYFNLAGSTLSAVVCVEEDKCLQILLNYLKKYNLISTTCSIGVLCFDGVMVYNKTFRGVPIKVSAIEDGIQTVQTQIKQDMGYPLKLKIKPFECLPMAVPQEWVDRVRKAEQGHKKKQMSNYINDSYYWMDFVNDVVRVTHDSFEAMSDAFKNNINRVMFRVFKFEKHLIRKINQENMFEFEDCTPKDVLRYRDINAKGNTVVKRITFGKLLHDTGLINSIDVYDDIDFKPYSELLTTPLKTEPRKFNMWTGFQAKLLPREDVDVSKIAMILDHIKLCWGAGDDHIYQYLLTWFKTIFTCPSKKSKVALVLKSTDKQIGKGIIINEFLIPLVFGRQYSMSEAGLESVVSRFNRIMMNKLFVNCDELSSLDAGFHQAFDILKKRITDGTIAIEIKGGRKFIYPDYSNYIFCTNHDFTIKLEQGDVRYLVLECSSIFKGNYAYFNELYKSFTQEVANHFYSYICYYNSSIVDIRNIPMTELKRNMIINSLQSPSRFLLDIQNGDYTVRDNNNSVEDPTDIDSVEEEPVWMSPDELYGEYENWVIQNNEKKLSKRKFLDDIKGKIEKLRTRTGMKYNITTGVNVVLE